MKYILFYENSTQCSNFSHFHQLDGNCQSTDFVGGWLFLKNTYIFIWLCWVFTAGMGSLIFLASCKIFSLRPVNSVAACELSCSMWDLVPWPGIEPRLPALGAWSLSHRNTREAPNYFLLCGQYCPEVTQVPVLMNKQAQSLVTASVRILHRNKTQRKAGGLDPVWEPQTRDPGRAKLLSPFCSIQAFNWLDEAHSG